MRSLSLGRAAMGDNQLETAEAVLPMGRTVSFFAFACLYVPVRETRAGAE
jgi:hypothetical protein